MIVFLTAGYICTLLCLKTRLEGHVHLFRLLVLRRSIDGFTTSFLSLLGFIGICVWVWSYYYLQEEALYNRFITLLTAFFFSIVLLVMFSNLFISLIGWDALGLTSFLLVVYYKNRKCLGSGIITAITNRIGDCFFIILLCFSLSLDTTLRLSLLLLMRITKRAQFPFSTWLPAAMAAPTPVRALVHSSTLVTAGVYILIRYCFSYMWSLVVVGTCTLLVAGICACAESDLKKVVALRTLSQLGVMIVAIGAQEKSYCFFHLIRHACFKALLFICVGVCIHSIYGTQDFRNYNALGSSIFLGVFMSVSNLSLAGFVYTAGFYRKDRILELLQCNEYTSFVVAFFLFGIFLTTCYSVKLQYMIMYRNRQVGVSSIANGGIGWPIKTPLIALGAASIVFRSDIINLFIVGLEPSDKYITIFLLLSGILFGSRSPGMNIPILRRFISLTPFSQSFTSTINTFRVSQKSIDKGWIEVFSFSLSGLVSSISWHYNTVLGIGFCMFFLFMVFYGKYPQECVVPWTVLWEIPFE